MTPEASICGLVFIHPEAGYPDIRAIGKEQYDSYSKLRGFDSDKARRFLGHLLK
jgi:5-methyltetrahydrofolate--homocysteine methyltransferase